MWVSSPATIALPLIGALAAGLLIWGWGFHRLDLGPLLGMYLLTAVGITVGFHQLFVHTTYETYTGVKFVLAAVGSMAVVGS